MALELDIQGLAAVKALAEARAVEKAAKQAAEDAADAVKALLGAERIGTMLGVPVVEVKEVTRHDVDAARLKAERPEIRAEYDKEIKYDKIVLA